MSLRPWSRFGQRALAILVALTLALVPLVSSAELTQTGEWPDGEPTVSLDLEGVSRADAIKKLAEAAGWSVVVHAPAGDEIDLRVEDQPPAKVLAQLLSDGRYEAARDGTLISIRPVGSPEPPQPPEAARPEGEPAEKASLKEARASGDGDRDVMVTGRSTTIEAGETVGDVTVMGGSLDMFGHATGDMTVVGGSAHIHGGAHVEGDAIAVGGSLTIDDGAVVDGDAGVVGGVLHRKENAQIGGDIDATGGGDRGEAADDHDEESLVQRASSAITRSALLFVLGAVLLALGAQRMERLTVEVAARPMRSFAMGIVGILAFSVMVLVLCITIVGIPIALVAILVAIALGFAATSASLTTIGAALASHRSQNVYVHLAVGCLVYLLAGAIPWVGGWLQAGIILVGLGALVSTRGAGFFEKTRRGLGDPYRDRP